MSNEQIVELHKEGLLKISHVAFEVGIKFERERIIELAQNRICFDHHKGCDHAGCYALGDLIKLIKGEQK